MRIKLTLLLLVCMALPSLAATALRGTVVAGSTGKPVAGANVMLRNQSAFVVTGSDGSFTMSDVKAGADVLEIVAYGFDDLDRDVNIVQGRVNDLGEISLKASMLDNSRTNDNDFLLEDTQIPDDEGMSQSIGTIQGANDNIYYNAANYFQPVRFRLRGYDSNLSAGYINGFYYNDAIRGRFNYSGLGGMTSSAFRNKTVDVGLAAAQYGYGNVGGATDFTTYASEYATGFRGNVSYTNSNYMLRAMLQYASGLNKHGWAFSASVIGRYAPEGVIEGTFYNSFGYSLSIEKVFNDQHRLNLTTWGAPTQRANNTAATQEAYDLAGNNLYNPAWGYLDGKKKTSRVVETFDPSVLLNWIWKPREGTQLNTGVGFRHSAYSSSALSWWQGADPRPDYYGYLPSYFDPTTEWSKNYVAPADRYEMGPDGLPVLDGEGNRVMTPLFAARQSAYEMVYDKWKHSKSHRQIQWDELYRANYLNRLSDDPNLKDRSNYILENRHSDFTSWMLNSYLDHRLSDIMTLQAGVSYNYTNSSYYKTIRNLMGGGYWLDVDKFSERDFPDQPDVLQNDLNNPNRKVRKGDRFGYDYNIRVHTARAWAQNQIRTRHWDVDYALELAYTSFLRHGNMRNGRAPQNSYGNGKSHNFFDVSAKAGATYKLNGRNWFTAHISGGTSAPLPMNSYISVRVKDTPIDNLKSEKFISGDISYNWNYAAFRGSVTGFYTHFWDQTKSWPGFYDYQLQTYMNYTMSGLQTEYKGVELGMQYNILSNLSVSAVATYAQYQYKNNPYGVRSYENGAAPDVRRKAYIKNYHLGGTPQQAYQIALNYTAPKMWFFELNACWFGDAYIDMAPARHEVMPGLSDICSSEAELTAYRDRITAQQKLNNAFVMNLSIGKLIYTKFGSLNFNLSVNNLLNNRKIQTGGYQEGKFDYTNYSVDKFPNKYYYAQGIRIFFNFGIRF